MGTHDPSEASFLPLYLIIFEGFFISGLSHLFSRLFCAPILMLRETDPAPAHAQQLTWILARPEELQQEQLKGSGGAETAPPWPTVRQELIQFNVATKTHPEDPRF